MERLTYVTDGMFVTPRRQTWDLGAGGDWSVENTENPVLKALIVFTAAIWVQTR